MTAQLEVIEAFARCENSPRRASNLRMEVMDDGYTAYLVSADHFVLAERHPIRNFTFYVGRLWREYGVYPRGATIRRSYVSRQHSTMLQFLRNNTGLTGLGADAEDPSAPPTTDEIDDL